MDRPALGVGRGRLALVDGLAQDVEQAAQRGLAHRHRDRRAGVDDLDAARQTVGGVHGHGAHLVVAQVLLHLGDEVDRLAVAVSIVILSAL